MFVAEDPAGWTPIHSLPVSLTVEQFWDGVSVWATKPHLINKGVGGVRQFDLGKHSGVKCLDEVAQVLAVAMEAATEGYLEARDRLLGCLHSELARFSSHQPVCDPRHSLFLNLLCPKVDKPRRDLASLVFFDLSNGMAIFTKPVVEEELKPKLSPDVTYGISMGEGALTLSVQRDTFLAEDDRNWLCSVLLPAIAKWSTASSKKPSLHSLSLIPADEYCLLYGSLKEKYGKALSDIWTEVTDPQKFIYEDIAIATYLILLWKQKQTRFVDLGCGNGLLVHILNSENHLGIGLDVRPRKIWQKYPPSTVLKVGTVTPSDSSLFPEADWIVGNHSDELSPWIPVIAARSSYRCNFFLLPCCAYEFNGRKYERSRSSLSQYADYVEYLKRVSDVCGFISRVDRLRIPSTKRICLVGEGRKYGEEEMAERDRSIMEFIESRTPTEGRIDTRGESKNWIEDFTARDSKERVRNCTQLNATLVQEIIEAVAAFLLADKTERSTDGWDEGKRTNLADIVNAIPKNKLVQLKAECGGLQTLLRNNRHIFRVEEGSVRFRRPSGESQLKDTKNWKKKPCWFFKNHPDSCPLESDVCSFMH